MTVPYHAAAAAVPGTLLVATLPAGSATEHAAPGTTTLVTAPQEIGPMSYTMSRHPRLDDDTGQRWLREAIVATLSTTRSRLPQAEGSPARRGRDQRLGDLATRDVDDH